MKTLLAVLFLLPVTVSMAQEKYNLLDPDSRKVVGHVEIFPDDVIEIDGKKFLLEQVVPPALKKATEIELSEFRIENATLEEAVEALRKAAETHDAKTADLSRKGLNIVFLGKSDARLTLALREIPLAVAIRYVAAASNYRAVFGEQGVQLVPED